MPLDPMWPDHRSEDAVLAEARARRQQFAVARAGITPEMAQRAIDLTRRWPNASPGAVAAAAAQGMSDEQFDKVAALDDGGADLSDMAGRAVGGILDFIGGTLEGAYEQVVKPTIRGAFLLFDTAAEELVQRPFTSALVHAQTHGSVDFGTAYRNYGNSEGVIAARNLMDSDPETGLDLGTGFFAGGEIGAESDAQRRLHVNGQKINVGRALTNGLIGRWYSPGDRAYDLTAGISQFAVDVGADPSALLTGGVASIAKAGRTLDRAAAVRYLDEAGQLTDDALRSVGAVSTTRRNTVLAERATQLFRDKNLLSRLAEADAYDIYKGWRSSPARRIDIETIGRLGRSTDEGEIAEILLEQVTRGHINERGVYGGMGTFVRSKINNAKFAGVAPKGLIDADDLDDAADKLDSLLRQANVDEFDRAEVFNAVASLQKGDATGLYNVASDAMARVAHTVELIDPKAAVDDIKEMTRIFDTELGAFRRYAHDAAGDPIQTPFVRKIVNDDGTTTLIPTPQLTSEMANMAIPLPDVDDIRRAATESSVLRRVYNNAGWQGINGGMRRVTNRYFKPLAIMRPAYVTRIGTEEQGRLIASGMDSLFTHPWRFIQANVLNRKAMTDLVGDDLTARANALGIINREASGVLQDAIKSRTQVWDVIPKVVDESGDVSEMFVKGWRHELGQLAAAPEARALARVRGNLDEFVDWARNTDEGVETIGRIAKINDEAARLLDDDVMLRDWGEGIWQRIAAKTGEDGELLDAIVDLRLAGVDLADELQEANLHRLLRDRIDRAPQAIKVEKTISGQGAAGNVYDKVLEIVADKITVKPTAYFARFPAWRQRIVANLGDMMPSMADDAMRDDVIRAAEEAFGLTKKEAKALAAKSVKARGVNGPLATMEQVNEIALGKAADEVKDLLFDITRRSAAQDTFTTIVPFLDAYMEVTKTWARLLKDNPAFGIRAAAGFKSMGESGVFHVNDFGDEVFTMPGGGMLSAFIERLNASGGEFTDIPGAALGAIADTVTGNTPKDRLELEGRVQGLNIVANGVGPGFGPVVQWGVGAFAPDSPDFQRLRDWVTPFGSEVDNPDDLASPGGVAEALLPAWLNKMRNAWTQGSVDPVQWNGTVGDVAKILANSGNYDPGSDADAQRLIDDAERGGAWVLFIRGLVQSTAPTGVQGVWKIGTEPTGEIPSDWVPEHDPDGRFHTISVLANEYRRMLETYGDPQIATTQFITLYGIEPYYVAQAKTRGIKELPVTQQGNNWIKEHRDLADRFPRTIGFFAPLGGEDEFDYSIYADQIARGDRQSLTAEQQVQLANQTKARQIMATVRKAVANAPKAQRDRIIAATNGWLEEQFPSWRAGVLGVPDGSSPDDKITELERALAEPELRDTPLYDPLAVYMMGRKMALDQLHAEYGPTATLGRAEAAPLRERLTMLGNELATRNGSFAAVWQRVLSREAEQ